MPLQDHEVFALTRQLVDIESTTGNEGPVGDFLHHELCRLGFQARKVPVEGARTNVYATLPEQTHPAVVFSTHMDTVPPFIPSSEDADNIYGRGSCDAKGIIAAQVAAAEKLRAEGIFAGLLFVVGEERDSLGAKVANEQAPGSRFLVNGEPTENHIATASKGALRVEFPDAARAQLLYRLVGPSDEMKHSILQAVNGLARAEIVLEIPYQKFRSVDGLPTMVAAFTTDIPRLGNWGEPLLIGPGSIHVAHTPGEYIEKKQLLEAVDLYARIAKKLLAS